MVDGTLLVFSVEWAKVPDAHGNLALKNELNLGKIDFSLAASTPRVPCGPGSSTGIFAIPQIENEQFDDFPEKLASDFAIPN